MKLHLKVEVINNLYVLHFLNRFNILVCNFFLARPVVEADVRKATVHVNSQLQIRRERCFVNELLYLEAPGPLVLSIITVKDVSYCSHLTLVSARELWVSDDKQIVLINIKGKSMHRIKDPSNNLYCGLHTVVSDGALIYINKEYNIMKLSPNMKKKNKFITFKDSALKPVSVYCSPFTGDILVGVTKDNPRTGIVMHYNRHGEKTKEIQHNNNGQLLYRKPAYITENINGDIVVSDLNNVVVTDRRGNYRFSYTSHRPYRQFYGVCCDSQSNILTCAISSKSVHVIDKNGHFLSHFQLPEIGRASCLSFDAITNRVYVGSYHQNNLCIYKHVSRQDSFIGECSNINKE